MLTLLTTGHGPGTQYVSTKTSHLVRPLAAAVQRFSSSSALVHSAAVRTAYRHMARKDPIIHHVRLQLRSCVCTLSIHILPFVYSASNHIPFFLILLRPGLPYRLMCAKSRWHVRRHAKRRHRNSLAYCPSAHGPKDRPMEARTASPDIRCFDSGHAHIARNSCSYATPYTRPALNY